MKFETIQPPYHFTKIINQGLTNDLFILNKQYFVKSSKKITNKFINWENQLNVTNLMKNQNFTLRILETKLSTKKLWVLMPYYHNLTTLTAEQINEKTLQQLAQLIKNLHQIKIKQKLTTWQPLPQLNLYCQLSKTNNEKISAIKKELEHWFKNYQPEKIVLCHNDLISNNFVCYKKQWYLIDWDFATLNDPLFDVASFISETLKTTTDINYWYHLFNLSPKELLACEYWIKYQNLIWYHWAKFLWKKTKNPVYQKIADEKIKMLLN